MRGGTYIDSNVQSRLTRGGCSGMLAGFGGISVRGSGWGPSSLGLLGAAPVMRQRGTLPIPPDEVGNYNDALQSKRCVVAYERSGENRPALEAAFRNAGVRHVKTFTG